MSDIIKLIKKLEKMSKFKFSKLFWMTIIIVSVLTLIIIMIMSAAKLANYDCIVFVLFKTLILLWIFVPLVLLLDFIRYLKHLWDMRVVAVIDPDPRISASPQNVINAKKQGMKYRKPTKEELKEWGLNRKEKFFVILKRFLYTPKLNDPDISMKDYRRIREEKDNKTP